MNNDIYIVQIEPQFGKMLYVRLSNGSIILELTEHITGAKTFNFDTATDLVLSLSLKLPQPFCHNWPVCDYRAVGGVYVEMEHVVQSVFDGRLN